DSFEKIPVNIFKTPKEGSAFAAAEIARLIRSKPRVVLGLATGSTPISLYAELVRLHQEDGLSFKNVITFNLDEYYPIEPTALQSHHAVMHRNLFSKVDIDPANIHIPDGTVAKDRIKEYCQEYEQKIASYGGIDLQVLGIGSNGHIGFNEPGSSRYS